VARRAVVLRFLPSTPGIVRAVRGFEDVEALEGVIAGPLVQIGQFVGDARSDGDRLAYVLSWGEDRATAFQRAAAAEARIAVDVEGPP